MDTVITKLIPIFILAFIGYTAGKLHILPDNTAEALCSFLFYFCSPAVSFSNIITSDVKEIFNIRFALAMIMFEAVIFLILFVLYKTVFRISGKSLVIHCLCSFYGNISYVGIPVFISLFNNVIPNIITLLIHGMLTFPLMVFLLDWFSGEGSHAGPMEAIGKSMKNPNIFIPLIASFLPICRIRVPQILINTAELLGRPTTTAGMFALGLTCSRSSLRSSAHVFLKALASALLKLLLCPVVAFIIGKFIFSLDSWWLNSIVILAMLPAALNDYILSQRYHSEEEFASVSVLLSTLLFSITITVYSVMIKL